jgi:hypothetical protein
MKKNILQVIMIFEMMVIFSGTVFASSLTFSPADISAKVGSTVKVKIQVNPADIKNFTVRAVVKFPADLLGVRSFAFESGWIPVTQSGYDLVNNTAGILAKTAGYPGGLTKTATLGTITFEVKKSGTGIIKFSDDSLALDATNKNLITSTSTAEIRIAVSTPKVTFSPTPNRGDSLVVSVSPTPTPSASTVADNQKTGNLPVNQYGTIGTILGLNNGLWWIWIVGIAIIAIVVSLVFRKKKVDQVQ